LDAKSGPKSIEIPIVVPCNKNQTVLPIVPPGPMGCVPYVFPVIQDVVDPAIPQSAKEISVAVRVLFATDVKVVMPRLTLVTPMEIPMAVIPIMTMMTALEKPSLIWVVILVTILICRKFEVCPNSKSFIHPIPCGPTVCTIPQSELR